MSSPAYEKLAIGATMSLAEGVLFGNMLESSKILNQSTQRSYMSCLRTLYARGGLYGLLYTGYFPSGAAQAVTKGIPILFVKGETNDLFLKHGVSPGIAGLFSSIASGSAQGLVVAPTQRLKTLALTNATGTSSIPFIMSVIKKDGLSTVMRGTTAMCTRRSFDWAIRFGAMDKIRALLQRSSGGEKQSWHTIVGGFIGGGLSALTLPLDCILAQTQKHGSKGNLFQVANQM